MSHELGGEAKVQRYKVVVERLLRAVCGADEFPWFVSDEATVFDVCTATEEELLNRLALVFGARVSAEELKLPIWHLACKLDESKR